MSATRHRNGLSPTAGGFGPTGHTARPASPRRPAAYTWAALALLAGLALTGGARHRQLQHQRAEQAASRRALADKSFVAIRTQLNSAELLLRAVQSLFLSSDEVTADEFADLYANLRPREQFPSLQALAYARRETQPDGEHYITRLVQPSQGNANVPGLDVGT